MLRRENKIIKSSFSMLKRERNLSPDSKDMKKNTNTNWKLRKKITKRLSKKSIRSTSQCTWNRLINLIITTLVNSRRDKITAKIK